MQHTCNTHATHMQHTCNTHATHMQHAYIHILAHTNAFITRHFPALNSGGDTSVVEREAVEMKETGGLWLPGDDDDDMFS
jgi:cytosine/adenosine deaminase-related metal-dependent hydrolase